jgi:hypothetical protein
MIESLFFVKLKIELEIELEVVNSFPLCKKIENNAGKKKRKKRKEKREKRKEKREKRNKEITNTS